MKVTFVTKRRIQGNKLKLVNRLSPRGFGAVGGVAPVILDFLVRAAQESSKKSSNEGVALLSRPSLGTEESKRLNDAMALHLSDRIDHLETIEQHFRPDGTIVFVLRKKKEELYQQGSEFSALYHQEYHADPPERLRKKIQKYDPEMLAQAYLAFVLKTGKEIPTQSDLETFSGTSQETWSRYLNKPEIWENVMKRLESLWNVHSYAKQSYEQARNNRAKNRRSKRSAEDATTNSSGEVGFYNEESSNDEETQIHEKLDELIRLEKLGRPTLVRRILSCDPKFSKNELDDCSVPRLAEILYSLQS